MNAHSSWKQKVDPAFPEFIKLYLFYLETVKLPSNEGYLSMELPEQYLKRFEIEGFPSIASIYEHDKPEDLQFDVISLFDDAATKQDFKKVTRKMTKDKHFFYETLVQIAGRLEENSREYYLKKFEPIKSENNYKLHIESMNEVGVENWRKENISDRQSLQWHYYVKVLEDAKQNIAAKRKTIVKRFNEQPKIFKRNIYWVWNTISLLVHRKGLKNLFNAARKGSDEALFKLIQIDKTLFDHDWLRERIRKAAYLGDWQFFTDLSKAISTDPINNRKIHGELFLILAQFWMVGLYRLTIPEVMELLKESGVRMQYDEVNFRKFVDREIKPLFKGW